MMKKNMIEKDAVPIESDPLIEEVNTEVVTFSGEGRIVESASNMVLSNQTNSSSVVTFEKCNGITLGTVINVGFPMGTSRAVEKHKNHDRDPFKKTPTIKEMLECHKPISDGFMDIISENFGGKWREATVVLGIKKLDVDRMYEDYFHTKGGTKAVTLLNFV